MRTTCKITSTNITKTSFWDAVEILIKKPHVVNKRLWGSKILFRSCYCYKSQNNATLPRNSKRIKVISEVQEFKTQIIEHMNLDMCTDEASPDIELILEEMLPKAYTDSHAFQLVILSRENGTAAFYDVTDEELKQNLCPSFPYTLCYRINEIELTADCESSSKSYQWLRNTVLPQFLKWTEEKCDNRNTLCSQSLSLVSNARYYSKYNDLKLKYGKEMVKIWPECTDPSKFVYEDVAIATYLLLLWEDERKNLNSTKYQTFVDLGCGNGLLVYILTKEGHQGVGIDVRRRLIWSIYPKEIILEEKTIKPSDADLFPETDWLIGNHSDELTPWIPVIAARSSFKCNFFLLPCCSYNFDGSKYQRQNSSMSQYNEYLQYVKQLCEDCGFQTATDRLKIPSTKRICLVGRGRMYPEEDYKSYLDKILNIIGDEPNFEKEDQKLWIKDFKPREITEKVRNCTQLDKTLLHSIVQIISKYLLDGCNVDSNWTIGRSIEISKAVELIPQEKLQALKAECGGLQTLIKNHHHIFQVQSGKVQLRYPKTIEEVKSNWNKKKTFYLQQRPCWFFNNHPQGCPLSDIQCSFLHTKDK